MPELEMPQFAFPVELGGVRDEHLASDRSRRSPWHSQSWRFGTPESPERSGISVTTRLASRSARRSAVISQLGLREAHTKRDEARALIAQGTHPSEQRT